jgi:small subunit ribosomal protein S20
MKKLDRETIMANHISSKKRIRRNLRAEVVNKVRKNRVRSFIKKVESAIEQADKTKAKEAFILAQPEMHRSVTRGVFKKNTISRKLSRLSARIKNIA